MSAHKFTPQPAPPGVPGKVLFCGSLGSNLVMGVEDQGTLVRVLMVKRPGEEVPVMVQADNLRLLLAMLDDDLVTSEGIVGPVNPWLVLKEIALEKVTGNDAQEVVADRLDSIVEMAKSAFLESGRAVPVADPPASKIILLSDDELLDKGISGA